jgi:chemotaxis protein CheX
MTLATDVENIARAIWESLLDSPIALGDDVALDDAELLTCLVQLHGAFEGVVMIQCPDELGVRLTAAMLHADTQPSNDDVIDALGELANMFAGNLKAILAKPSFISLPTVVVGSNYECNFTDTTVVARVPFVSEGYPLVVTILQQG